MAFARSRCYRLPTFLGWILALGRLASENAELREALNSIMKTLDDGDISLRAEAVEAFEKADSILSKLNTKLRPHKKQKRKTKWKPLDADLRHRRPRKRHLPCVVQPEPL